MNRKPWVVFMAALLTALVAIITGGFTADGDNSIVSTVQVAPNDGQIITGGIITGEVAEDPFRIVIIHADALALEIILLDSGNTLAQLVQDETGVMEHSLTDDGRVAIITDGGGFLSSGAANLMDGGSAGWMEHSVTGNAGKGASLESVV